ERRDAVEHIDSEIDLTEDRLDVVERRAAREGREAIEELLLLGAQEVVAPLDGRAQRLLPRREIALAADEQLEQALQPREERSQREHAKPRRRELDRERRAAEAIADPCQRRRVVAVERERCIEVVDAIEEEPHRLAAREIAGRRTGARLGDGER